MLTQNQVDNLHKFNQRFSTLSKESNRSHVNIAFYKEGYKDLFEFIDRPCIGFIPEIGKNHYAGAYAFQNINIPYIQDYFQFVLGKQSPWRKILVKDIEVTERNGVIAGVVFKSLDKNAHAFMNLLLGLKLPWIENKDLFLRSWSILTSEFDLHPTMATLLAKRVHIYTSGPNKTRYVRATPVSSTINPFYQYNSNLGRVPSPSIPMLLSGEFGYPDECGTFRKNGGKVLCNHIWRGNLKRDIESVIFYENRKLHQINTSAKARFGDGTITVERLDDLLIRIQKEFNL